MRGTLVGMFRSRPRLAGGFATGFAALALLGVVLVSNAGSAQGVGTPLKLATSTMPPLPSGAGVMCPLAGLLPVRVERSGETLTFVSVSTEQPVSLSWPNGYTARLVNGVAELLTPTGTVLARQGDVLSDLGGGSVGDTFYVCSTGNNSLSNP